MVLPDKTEELLDATEELLLRLLATTEILELELELRPRLLETSARLELLLKLLEIAAILELLLTLLEIAVALELLLRLLEIAAILELLAKLLEAIAILELRLRLLEATAIAELLPLLEREELIELVITAAKELLSALELLSAIALLEFCSGSFALLAAKLAMLLVLEAGTGSRPAEETPLPPPQADRTAALNIIVDNFKKRIWKKSPYYIYELRIDRSHPIHVFKDKHTSTISNFDGKIQAG